MEEKILKRVLKTELHEVRKNIVKLHAAQERKTCYKLLLIPRFLQVLVTVTMLVALLNFKFLFSSENCYNLLRGF
jgi:hypothetical protein